MSTLKEENKEFARSVTESLDIPIKTITDYPGNFGIYVDVIDNSQHKAWQAGGFLFFFSSASRMGYADYSGKLIFDNKVHQITFGGILQTDLYQSDRTMLFFKALLGLSIVNNVYESTFELADGTVQYESDNYSPLNVAIMPSIRYSKAYRKNVWMFLESGFLIDLPGNLFSKDPNNSAIISAQGDGPAVEMTGVRCILGVEILINR